MEAWDGLISSSHFGATHVNSVANRLLLAFIEHVSCKIPKIRVHIFYQTNLSALATSKAWSRVNAAREIVAAGVSGEYSRTAEQLRRRLVRSLYSCTVDLGILADVHAAVHSAAARFVMILCMQLCFATDSDLYCCCCSHGCQIGTPEA